MSLRVDPVRAAAYAPDPSDSLNAMLLAYLRRVQQSVASGDMTLAQQQINAVQARLRTVGASVTAVGGPALASVQQYVDKVAEQIRAGQPDTAQQTLLTAKSYAEEIVAKGR